MYIVCCIPLRAGTSRRAQVRHGGISNTNTYVCSVRCVLFSSLNSYVSDFNLCCMWNANAVVHVGQTVGLNNCVLFVP